MIIKNKKILLVFGFCMSLYGIVFFQNQQKVVYSLDDCIEINNNLNLKSSKLNAKSSKIDYKQSQLDVLPNLNANYNLGITNGRSIDPFTNNYINQELTFSNAELTLNTTVFNGFRMLDGQKVTENGLN